MVEVYTTPSCASCRKAKKWLEDHGIEYREIKLYSTKLTKADLIRILDKTENGFDDIISKRSKIISEGNIDVDSMKTTELLQFIIDNPSVLRRPIIVDSKRLQVGYNDEEIRSFLSREDREKLMCDGRRCAVRNQECDYLDALKDALKIRL